MPQMVFTAGPDGLVDYCNRRWFYYTGQDAEAAMGLGWRRAIHPDDREAYGSAWERSRDNERSDPVAF